MPRAVLHCSRRYVGTYRVDDLEELLEQVVQLDAAIRADEETIYCQQDVWEAELQPGIPVYTALCDQTCEVISRDLKFSLLIALERSAAIDDDDLAQRIIRGRLGPFPGGTEEDLNSVAGWRSMVRAHLSVEPGSIEYFSGQCVIAFDRLTLSSSFPQCLRTLDGGLDENKSTLISALSSLNDDWDLYVGGDLPLILKAFSAKCGFSTTLEGNGGRKAALTFTFLTADGKSEQVLCEPHMKLGAADAPGDSSYHFHRIYFNPRPHPAFEGKILVGHAGEHL